MLILLGWSTSSSSAQDPRFKADLSGRKSDVTAPAAVGFPQLIDITDSTGIQFDHLPSPEQKYIVESMSGGVALIDYDRDGWPDIYFTNAQSVEMALAGKKSRSALYHNNHDGTFTDVTDKAGVGYPCWAMGAVVGD
jgi:enediyne biosynthesis protein E4